jgi:hypothetical protein
MVTGVDVAAAAEATVALFGILTTCWAVAKWTNRPRFICGVPPGPDEQKAKGISPEAVGRVSVSHGFRHRRRCFACRLWRRHKRTLSSIDLRRTTDPMRCRDLRVGPDGTVSFAVLIANAGHRIALDYTASIFTYEPEAEEGLHLVDVLTEGLEFNLYVGDPGRLRRDALRKRLASDTLRDDYSYQTQVGHTGDGIYLSGSIVEAGSYELVHMEADAATFLDHFYLLINVSCSDGWMRDATYVQRCNLRQDRDSAPPTTRNVGVEPVEDEDEDDRPLGPGSSGGPGRSRREPARRGAPRS